MSSPLPTTTKHALRILRLWPADATRNVTFRDYWRKRIAESSKQQQQQSPMSNATNTHATTSSSSSPSTASTPSSTASSASTSPPLPTDEAQINALYSLIENRYSKKYPVSERLFKPAFRPTYYDELLREMEEAPKRSWLQRKWMRWSHIIRLS